MRLKLQLALLLTLLPAAAHPQAAPTDPWYNHAVIYEIYPRSFQDSNGDGIGDLNGITQRLDYLQSLGVDAIWIAPMYPSPQVDFGYDIANYTAVDPQYGTLADFDRLLAAAKQRHIRVLLDMVLNHTSDKHPWFIDSARSRTNPYADWYIWNNGIPAPKRAATTKPGPNEHLGPHGWVVPPNNWSSLFQGSAWEWVPARGQFYYHFFYKQQPDLNWRNPAVEKAMFDAMRFWLDRGVAGFRLDAITTLFEDPTLHNEPLTGKLDASGFPESNHTLTSGLPQVHEVLRRLRTLIDSYPDQRVLVGEIYVPKTSELLQWYGTPSAPELQLPMDTLVGFHTEGGGQSSGANVQLNLPHFRQSITEMETQLDNHQPLLVFDNHDNTRSWDRFAPPTAIPENKLRIAKLIATILYTTRSAALTYYGAEIGMTTHTPARREDVRDPIGITGWPKEKGRDGERTPMQWTPKPPAAGFSTNSHPWLPIGADYPAVNVATETGQPDTLLTWTHSMIDLRRSYPALRDGGIVFLDTTNPGALTFVRTTPAGRGTDPIARPVFIAVNFTDKPQVVHPNLAASGMPDHYTWVHMDANIEFNSGKTLTTITLPPYAAIITGLQ